MTSHKQNYTIPLRIHFNCVCLHKIKIMEIINKVTFPEFTGVKCLMMPFIQGDSNSLPDKYKSYSDIVDNSFLEKGQIGFLTIDESFVEKDKSQRGYNSTGISRNVHIEVGHINEIYFWGSGDVNPPTWGGKASTILDESTQVLIANSIDDTCRVWNNKEFTQTNDGDLSHVIDKYPKHTGRLLKSGEIAKISIFTPHECIDQTLSSNRQFFRIVGKGVSGREDYFTVNPLIKEI